AGLTNKSIDAFGKQRKAADDRCKMAAMSAFDERSTLALQKLDKMKEEVSHAFDAQLELLSTRIKLGLRAMKKTYQAKVEDTRKAGVAELRSSLLLNQCVLRGSLADLRHTKDAEIEAMKEACASTLHDTLLENKSLKRTVQVVEKLQSKAEAALSRANRHIAILEGEETGHAPTPTVVSP
ncbi:unnamed protein product, partial [Chrysoparadoxa australica]